MRIFLLIITIVLIFFGGSYFIDQKVLNHSPELAYKIAEKLKDKGILITETTIQKTSANSSSGAFSWHGIKTNMNLSEEKLFFPLRPMQLLINDIRVQLDFLNFTININSSNLEVFTIYDKNIILQNANLEATIPLSLIMEGKKGIEKNLNYFIKTGETNFPFNFTGIIGFDIQGEWVKGQLQTIQYEGKSRLVMNPESLRILSWLMKEELTNAEIDFLAAVPMRVPSLLRITNKAKIASEKAHEIDETIPEDAYRHVLWSYLLTQNFGPEFSKDFTDAHEKGDVSNTEADHRMDFTNNDIGRKYALNGVLEKNLLNTLLNDQKVIRIPQ